MNGPTQLQPLTFPLSGSRLIEASAGTGKTYTIAALYVRLVLGHGGDQGFAQPLLPPQILVVTFTDAATRELRDRIRARLTEAARYFRSETVPADPFLLTLRGAYPEEAWGGCARRLEIAAQWMDEAAVSTIHAWCHRMLREHAFDSGSPFTQALETDQRDLLAEVCRDYWRSFVYCLGPSDLSVVLARWKHPDELLKSLQSMLAIAEPPQPDANVASIIHAALVKRADQLRKLKAPWAVWLEELSDLLEQAAADKAFAARSLNTKSRAEWIDALRLWRDTPGMECPALTETAFKRLTPSGLAAIWKQGLAPPDHPALEAIASLPADLRRLPQPVADVQRHAAGWIRQRFQWEQRRRAQLGFNDLLTRLDEALHGDNAERLSAVIRAQFPVALIDEFQDTDPVQYRIFDRVYRIAENLSEHGLFMIGDPKQAIYAFRGADIYTYLQAREATTGRHYTLERNFRSTQGMVEAVNRVFQAAEQRQAGNGAFLFRRGATNPVPFVHVQANGLSKRFLVQAKQQPPLNCWHALTPEPLAKGAYLRQMAAGCASEIVRLLNLSQAGAAGFAGKDGVLQPLQPADMAVLVRDGKEAAAIRAQLAARGVRSVYFSDKESVFDSVEARDMLLWLKACAKPDADRTLRAALASSTLDLDWAALEHLNQDEGHWESRVLQFRHYHRLWRQQGVLPMLRRLMADFHVQARLMRREGGERAMTNLLHLAELLQLAATELDGEQALIRHLAEHLANADHVADEQVVRLESDEALVKVVTIHKAKGMEYPLVFLPFICTFREVDRKTSPVRFHSADGALVIEPHPDKEELALADQERVAEDMRLLYVALTRARHSCWLGFASIKYGAGKASQLHKSAVGYLLSAGAPIAVTELASRLADLRGDSACIHVLDCPPASPVVLTEARTDGQLGFARVPVRAARECWWIASYSALTLSAEVDAAGQADDNASSQTPDTPMEANLGESHDAPGRSVLRARPVLPGDESLHRFPRGPNPGTFLHGLLEWAARTGFQRVAADQGLLEDAIARRCNRRGWSHWINPVLGWMQRFLETPWCLPSAPAVALSQLRVYQPELEFWFETHHVDARELDQQIRAHTLDGLPRPAVERRMLNGMLKGFIDLVFEHQGRYYVADYKSNWLGEDNTAYTLDAMRDAVLEHRYDLQYVLYTLALHRLLKARLPNYEYDTHVGGAVYLFLRGSLSPSQGLHMDKPSLALIQTLDNLVSGSRDTPCAGGGA